MIGSRLKTFALQKKAIVARYGGDEFLLICSNKKKRLEGFAETLHRDLTTFRKNSPSSILLRAKPKDKEGMNFG